MARTGIERLRQHKTKLSDRGQPVAPEDTSLASQSTGKPPALRHGEFFRVPIDQIQSDPDQPRKHFDEEKLAELAQSIKSQGVLEPVLIRPGENGEVILVAGERRWRAAKAAGLAEVPCVVTAGNPDEISLIENLHREDLNAMEEAEAYQGLIDKYEYTHEQVSEIVHKPRPTVTAMLTLNSLPPQVKEECRTSDVLPRKSLIAIARQGSERKMLSLYKRAKKSALTYQEIREIAAGRRKRGQEEKIAALIKSADSVARALGKLNLKGVERDKTGLQQALDRLKKAVTKALKEVEHREQTLDEEL